MVSWKNWITGSLDHRIKDQGSPDQGSRIKDQIKMNQIN